MIEEDIRTALIADAGINALVGSRIYKNDPIDEQSATYLTFDRPSKERDMVRERNRFRIFVYSKDMDEVETLAGLLIAFFENKTSLNSNEYYKIVFLGQTDNPLRLDNGFYYTLMNFQFDHTT